MKSGKAGPNGSATPTKRSATSGDVAARIRRAYDAKLGWSDFTLPDLADLLAPHPEIDAAEFSSWFASRLAYYRASEKAREASERPSDEREYIRQLLAAVRRVRDLTSPRSEPPGAGAHLHIAYFRAGRDWATCRNAVRTELRSIELTLGAIDLGADEFKGSAGRPSMVARKELLGAVGKYLRGPGPKLKADVARELAASLLDRCGVAVPLVKGAGNTRAVRRAERGGPK